MEIMADLDITEMVMVITAILVLDSISTIQKTATIAGIGKGTAIIKAIVNTATATGAEVANNMAAKEAIMAAIEGMAEINEVIADAKEEAAAMEDTAVTDRRFSKTAQIPASLLEAGISFNTKLIFLFYFYTIKTLFL
jgi:hypothetical protein